MDKVLRSSGPACANVHQALRTCHLRPPSHGHVQSGSIDSALNSSIDSAQLSHVDRRRAMALLVALPVATTFLPSPASADTTLPKAYEKTAHSLVDALRDAIDADISGAPEREVRRKADPAKDLVRQFMTRWRDVPIVKDDVSYIQLTAAIKQLGEYYMSQGQRASLTDEVGKALLARLDAAEAALPPAPAKPFFPF